MCVLSVLYYKILQICIFNLLPSSPSEITSLKPVFETTPLQSIVQTRWTVALGAQSIADDGWVFRGQGRQVKGRRYLIWCAWTGILMLQFCCTLEIITWQIFAWFRGLSWRSELSRFGLPCILWGFKGTQYKSTSLRLHGSKCKCTYLQICVYKSPSCSGFISFHSARAGMLGHFSSRPWQRTLNGMDTWVPIREWGRDMYHSRIEHMILNSR